jgi:hypothetical protein
MPPTVVVDLAVRFSSMRGRLVWQIEGRGDQEIREA